MTSIYENDQVCECGHKFSDHSTDHMHRCIENTRHSWEEVRKWPLWKICICVRFKAK